jgi:hypothetical protein
MPYLTGEKAARKLICIDSASDPDFSSSYPSTPPPSIRQMGKMADWLESARRNERLAPHIRTYT